MPNTYTQIHIQFVFAVKYRRCLIAEAWEEELYKYMAGIIRNHGHKVLAINGMPDHIHIFVGMRPHQSVSELMQQVKRDSCRWINEMKFLPEKFEWQSGYGAFSYAMSEVPVLINYVRKQKEHHRKRRFPEEYKEILKKFDVEYEDKYLFTEPA